jgi:hypothetical protein
MLSIVCYVLAGILFLLCGLDQTIFGLNGLREIGWGLFFVVLAWVLAGVGPPMTWGRDARG